MTILVDTHAFLWYVSGDRRLPPRARRAIGNSDDGWVLSAASVWEIAIKSSLGRLTLPAPVDEYMGEKVHQGLRILAIEWSHAAAVESLPFHHRDPFDRLIIAQAKQERLAVVTKDSVLRKYGVKTVW